MTYDERYVFRSVYLKQEDVALLWDAKEFQGQQQTTDFL